MIALLTKYSGVKLTFQSDSALTATGNASTSHRTQMSGLDSFYDNLRLDHLWKFVLSVWVIRGGDILILAKHVIMTTVVTSMPKN